MEISVSSGIWFEYSEFLLPTAYCLVLSLRYMILGIILLLLGLGVFIGAGVQLDDSPGVEKKTVVIMMIGIALIIWGGILLYSNVFGL